MYGVDLTNKRIYESIKATSIRILFKVTWSNFKNLS